MSNDDHNGSFKRIWSGEKIIEKGVARIDYQGRGMFGRGEHSLKALEEGREVS